jgi:hypothetical protein
MAKRFREFPESEWEDLKTQDRRKREQRNKNRKSNRKKRIKEKYGH